MEAATAQPDVRLHNRRISVTEVSDPIADALGDVGCWRWWAENLPLHFQLEFSGAQLAERTPDGIRPIRVVALRYTHPQRIAFIDRRSAELPPDWPERLRADAIDPLALSHDRLATLDASHAQEILAEVVHWRDVVGAGVPTAEEWNATGARLVFFAGSAGMCVLAQDLAVLTQEGTLRPDQVADAHALWWQYWRDYWDRRGTDAALPGDWVCEVTIPMRPGPS